MRKKGIFGWFCSRYFLITGDSGFMGKKKHHINLQHLSGFKGHVDCRESEDNAFDHILFLNLEEAIAMSLSRVSSLLIIDVTNTPIRNISIKWAQ